MGETVIKAENISKEHRHYDSNLKKMQHLLFGKDTGEKTLVLQDVSFEIEKGEKVGIIGKTTTESTTLLRILAGVIQPDSGSYMVSGEVTALIDNKFGFESSLSGRENYVVRCSLLGWPKEMIKEKEEEIFEFAGLTNDIDKPLRLYRKTGISRLGFTISTETKPEILLYGDSLSFGGSKNSNQCIKRLKELVEGDDTTVLMNAFDRKGAAQICSRGLVIHEGALVFDGPFEDAVSYFKENCSGVNEKKGVLGNQIEEEPKDSAPDDNEGSDDLDAMDDM